MKIANMLIGADIRTRNEDAKCRSTPSRLAARDASSPLSVGGGIDASSPDAKDRAGTEADPEHMVVVIHAIGVARALVRTTQMVFA